LASSPLLRPCRAVPARERFHGFPRRFDFDDKPSGMG
jgi:hypothetical protein